MLRQLFIEGLLAADTLAHQEEPDICPAGWQT